MTDMFLEKTCLSFFCSVENLKSSRRESFIAVVKNSGLVKGGMASVASFCPGSCIFLQGCRL